jgi:hypothetical protein
MPVPAVADGSAKQSSSANETNDNNNAVGSVTITNPSVEVTLPVLRYGYRTTKATWEELVEIIEVEQNIPKLSRSREQQHEYEVFRYHMKEQYASTLDYILISKFGFEAKHAKDDSCHESDKSDDVCHKWMAYPSLHDVQTPTIILVKNDFPYCVQDNIEHYVLWKLREAITSREILDARDRLTSEPIRSMAILQWINPPNLKSIPEIDHVHFLCKIQKET